MGLGIEGDAAPRSKIDAPRGRAAVNRGLRTGSKKPGALIPCYGGGEYGELNCPYVLIEAQRATYIVQEETPKP